MDYRQLNALTLESKFPLPVIDEIFVELARASWFSKLDLKVGYHQTRLPPAEGYKTATHTYHGHFEFTVMVFGLNGALGTF